MAMALTGEASDLPKMSEQYASPFFPLSLEKSRGHSHQFLRLKAVNICVDDCSKHTGHEASANLNRNQLVKTSSPICPLYNEFF